MKDRLFLLRPGFMNAGLGPLYCSDSAPVEGVLSFFPQLRQLLEVHYLEFARPRRALIDVLGEQQQSLPVLVLSHTATLDPDAPSPREASGERFFADEKQIRQYLSLQYRLPEASE